MVLLAVSASSSNLASFATIQRAPTPMRDGRPWTPRLASPRMETPLTVATPFRSRAVAMPSFAPVAKTVQCGPPQSVLQPTKPPVPTCIASVSSSLVPPALTATPVSATRAVRRMSSGSMPRGVERRSSSCTAPPTASFVPASGAVTRSSSPIRPRNSQPPVIQAQPLLDALDPRNSLAADICRPVVQCKAVSSSSEARVEERDDFVMNSNTSFSVEELLYDTPQFDPSALRCRQQLAAMLGMSEDARIEVLQGGGLNQGMWTMCDSCQSLVLKLVRSQRTHRSIPTETEKLVELSRSYPNLVHDRDVSFPLKIFLCRGPRGQSTHDLIAMHKAPGECFMNVINRKCFSRKIPELMDNFEALGCFVANIHNKYGLRHGDCQPSNIFFNEATGQCTLIDIADLSPPGQNGVRESDVEHFCNGVRLVTRCHGHQVASEGTRRFQAGYARHRNP